MDKIEDKIEFEIQLSHDNEGLKVDILEHTFESSIGTLVQCSYASCECIKTITTFEELHKFMVEHKLLLVKLVRKAKQ